MQSFKPGESVKVNLMDEGSPPLWVPAVYRCVLSMETALRDDGTRPHLVYIGDPSFDMLVRSYNTLRLPDDRIIANTP